MPSSASRDLGLERIGRTTRYLAVGGLLAGGVLSAAVAKTLPGHSSAHRATTSPTAPTPATAPPSSASQDDSPTTSPAPTDPPQTVAPPAQAPQPTYSAPVASSGGS